MSSRHDVIASEIAELEGILATMPPTEVVARISFESRLQSARAALAEIANVRLAKKAKLTFRGKPVLGSHGMAADFAGKAAGAFADAFAAVATGLNESLHYAGPISDRGGNQLLITGIAIGSFGFEFELPPEQEDRFLDAGRAEEALQKLQDILKISAEGSDDAMTELVEEVHPRAARKVADFLDLLVQQQALCGLEFDDRFFRYDSSEQLRVSAARLQEENIRAFEEEYVGSFAGVLPSSRTFEFNLSDGGGPIRGKVAAEIGDPDILNREWLKRPARIRLGVIQVGQGRPRFTLKSLESIALL